MDEKCGCCKHPIRKGYSDNEWKHYNEKNNSYTYNCLKCDCKTPIHSSTLKGGVSLGES